MLFATDILQNIAFGKRDASLEVVQAAARAANAAEFVERLLEGYHTQARTDNCISPYLGFRCLLCAYVGWEVRSPPDPLSAAKFVSENLPNLEI